MENRYLYRGKRTLTDNMWVYWDGFSGVQPNTVIEEETICQCTGLKDKNGKLIWENDVIRCNYETCIVKWEKSEWRIKWIDEAVWRRDLDYWVNESKREVNVVGNIFDNPELLEV